MCSGGPFGRGIRLAEKMGGISKQVAETNLKAYDQVMGQKAEASGTPIPTQKPMAQNQPTGSVSRNKKKTRGNSRAGVTIGLNAKPRSQSVGTGINTNQ